MNLRTLCIISVLLMGFSSCATHRMSARGQRNLDDWERSKVYDPATGRYFSTQNINESQMDPLLEADSVVD